ncbi:hypothetical protein JNUCC1_02723 [Lentibacillus sp. JNUCC-1]|nr:hypothetical protein [Lentibacillus sp. JNUCC-1]
MLKKILAEREKGKGVNRSMNTQPPRRSLNIPLAEAGESHHSRKIREANRRILGIRRSHKKHTVKN